MPSSLSLSSETLQLNLGLPWSEQFSLVQCQHLPITLQQFGRSYRGDVSPFYTSLVSIDSLHNELSIYFMSCTDSYEIILSAAYATADLSMQL